jgi:hypothetical protein
MHAAAATAVGKSARVEEGRRRRRRRRWRLSARPERLAVAACLSGSPEALGVHTAKANEQQPKTQFAGRYITQNASRRHCPCCPSLSFAPSACKGGTYAVASLRTHGRSTLCARALAFVLLASRPVVNSGVGIDIPRRRPPVTLPSVDLLRCVESASYPSAADVHRSCVTYQRHVSIELSSRKHTKLASERGRGRCDCHTSSRVRTPSPSAFSSETRLSNLHAERQKTV